MKEPMQTDAIKTLGPVQGGFFDEAISLLAGAAFTAALVAGMARFESRRPEPPVEFQDLRPIAMAVEAPPPPTIERPHETAAVAAMPLIGIEAAASDSAVKIAVVPPDLESLIPASSAPPAAMIEPMGTYTDLKPKFDLSTDVDRIYQKSEVDQRPMVLRRPNPAVPGRVRKNAARLYVSTLLVVDRTGAVTNLRVIKSSGNAEFDDIIVRSIKEDWVFAPASKKGKKVRCMIEQAVHVIWPKPSPFST